MSALDIAIAAWCRYFVATERFDRSICERRSPRSGDAIPADPWERAESAAFASEQKLLDCDLAGVCAHDSQYAKELAGGWSLDRQIAHLAIEAAEST